MKRNQPNIISNELDQAPKTGKNYMERLHDPVVKKQIADTMRWEFFAAYDSNEKVNEEMLDRFDRHQKELPLDVVAEKLKDNKKVSVLYHKKNTKDESKGSERHKTIGALMPAEIQFDKLGVSLHRKGESLSDGDLGTYLTFEKNDYGQIVIGAEQIEIPQKPLTMSGLACHKKMELSEFLKYIKNEESKNPNKKSKTDETNGTVDAAYEENDSEKRKQRSKLAQRLLGKK